MGENAGYLNADLMRATRRVIKSWGSKKFTDKQIIICLTVAGLGIFIDKLKISSNK